MKKTIIIYTIISLVLIGCNQTIVNNNEIASDSTVKNIYGEAWNSNSVIIKNVEGEIIKSIEDKVEIKQLINKLKGAKWQENIEVDIRPPDYYFKWNSYTHNLWINEETSRLEVSIEGMSNYGIL